MLNDFFRIFIAQRKLKNKKKHLIIYYFYLFTEVGQLVLFISIKSDVTAMSQSTQE